MNLNLKHFLLYSFFFTALGAGLAGLFDFMDVSRTPAVLVFSFLPLFVFLLLPLLSLLSVFSDRPLAYVRAKNHRRYVFSAFIFFSIGYLSFF